MDNNNNEQKPKKASSKEIMMIVIVVVLAFGLTVAGIVYLTNFLIGDNPSETQLSQPDPIAVPQAPTDNTSEGGDVVRFSAGDDQGLGSAVTPPVETPAVTPPASTTTPAVTTPPATVSAPPVATTPPPATVTPPAAVSTPTPAPTRVASIPSNIPRTSPTRGAYQLQLSAFKSEERAIAEAKRYIRDYPDIYIMQADLGAEGVWFRVRCCSAGSQDELAKIKADLERKYEITPYVVRVR